MMILKSELKMDETVKNTLAVETMLCPHLHPHQSLTHSLNQSINQSVNLLIDENQITPSLKRLAGETSCPCRRRGEVRKRNEKT